MSFRYKLDSSKMKKKSLLRYVIVTRLQQNRKTLTHMAIVTEQLKFAEYEFGIYCNSITPTVASRIRQMFEDFQVTSNTEVIFNKEYGKENPIYMYFQFLRQQMNFNLRNVSIEAILRTISKYHGLLHKTQRRQITRNDLESIWNSIVEKEKCQWITKQFDYYLKEINSKRAKERKLVRLSAYYLVIKNIASSNKNKFKIA